MIDYILVCDFLLNYLERMLIDENQVYVLTKYGKGRQTVSDHNILYARFAIKYSTIRMKTKREIFDFKNESSQKDLVEVTDSHKKLSACFQSVSEFRNR